MGGSMLRLMPGDEGTASGILPYHRDGGRSRTPSGVVGSLY